jgi:hypothetical protein
VTWITATKLHLSQDGVVDWSPKRPPPRRRRLPIGSTLAIAVLGWWLLLGAAIAWLVSEPAVSATPTPFTGVPGQTARIHRPAVPAHPIAANRAGLDAFQRSIRENDEGLLEEAYMVSNWFAVGHGQMIRITAVDGDAIQIELLEGPYAGRPAWVATQDLGPTQ